MIYKKAGLWNKIDKPKNKNQARHIGIQYQTWANNQNLSYGQLSAYQDDLYKIAKRFGLIREFRENGLL